MNSRLPLVTFLFLALGLTNAHALFEGAVEAGRSVSPAGSMDFGITLGGSFKTYPVKGFLTTSAYSLPPNRTRAELFTEIQTALRLDGYQIYVAHDEQSELDIQETHLVREIDTSRAVYREDADLITVTTDPAKTGGFYISGKKHDLDKDTYLVATLSNAQSFAHVTTVEVANRVIPQVTAEIKVTEEIVNPASGVDTQVVETIVLTKERIRLEIEAKGHINIYGIQFDIDQATIRPESFTTLDAIGEYLMLYPQYSYYVVGHTSDTGSFDHNMKLSVDRAQAVINSLVPKFSIAPTRLAGYGVGPVAPVDSNFTAQGRAHNRRVVLIRRLPSPAQAR